MSTFPWTGPATRDQSYASRGKSRTRVVGPRIHLYLAVVVGLLVAPALGGTMPPINTAFLILMENCPWSQVKGSASAPYINQTLLPQASYCEQYYSPSDFTCSLA